MNEYSNFTSLTPQDEAAMVVFERSTTENLQKSMMIALIAAVGIGLLSVVIFFGFPPPAKKHAAAEPEKAQTQSAPAEAAPAPAK
jgi:hypothetical protein